MTNLFKIIYRYITSIGINPILTLKGIKNIGFYFFDFLFIRKQIKKIKYKGFPLALNFPCLHDKYDNGGTAKGHYFHQDLLVASKVYKGKPERHVDIGSRLDGFVSHLATFMTVEVFDIREVESKTDTILFKKADLMKLDDKYINYTTSISSLHAIEHFGLGRYGDPIDIDGHIKGLNNIYKILKKGGVFYFSVPIGKQRIEFNAHRVFSIKYLVDYFNDKYDLKEFSYVDDDGDLHQDVDITLGIENNFGCNFGCGIFSLIKK